MNVAIVVPLFNQLAYTKKCLQSLTATVDTGTTILVIDNSSTDGTGEYLASLEEISVIHNETNLGCAGAWNQGISNTQSEWVVILNNDVILSWGWLEGLIEFAEESNLDVVSPAIREGDYNYNIEEYAREFVRRMSHVSRPGEAHGICFMVRRRVFEKIGLFDENFRIGQFEDADFFRRANAAGFNLGITGRSFIHHFGSMTQKLLGQTPYATENRAYFHKKWHLTWWRRFLLRRRKKLLNLFRRTKEKALYRHTLIEKWIDGRLRYY
jgi:N-acetylglucosaminyl-diphospho-decaprenol L-rhamnosyltransferase